MPRERCKKIGPKAYNLSGAKMLLSCSSHARYKILAFSVMLSFVAWILSRRRSASEDVFIWHPLDWWISYYYIKLSMVTNGQCYTCNSREMFHVKRFRWSNTIFCCFGIIDWYEIICNRQIVSDTWSWGSYSTYWGFRSRSDFQLAIFGDGETIRRAPSISERICRIFTCRYSWGWCLYNFRSLGW